MTAELIERLERGQTGRLLDAKIAQAFGAYRYRNWYDDPERTIPAWHVMWSPKSFWEPLPYYSLPENRAETLAALLKAEAK